MRIVTTAREAHEIVRAQKEAGKQIGLVPTMGALHEGHLSLVDRSKHDNEFTVASIFVNPKQFGPQEDLSKYPRMMDADLGKLAARKVDLVFAPPVEEMYPSGFATHVEVNELTQPWEGEFRPAHFRGVTTVVLKLFNILPADRAYFGQKDYQQALVVRQMAADLNVPIEIVVCPTVREPDGLAMSSRNQYLTTEERRSAKVISRSLRKAGEMFIAGERDAAKLRDSISREIAVEPGVKIDYVAIVDPERLSDLSRIDTSAVALIAARIGATRLIDNEILK